MKSEKIKRELRRAAYHVRNCRIEAKGLSCGIFDEQESASLEGKIERGKRGQKKRKRDVGSKRESKREKDLTSPCLGSGSFE